MHERAGLGGPAPELVGETLQGEPLDVGSLRGDVVVLNFWADWCGPCRAEAPFLNAVAERTKDEGVRFVGVNVKDDRNAALAFERVREVTYPSIYDPPFKTAAQLGGVPSSVIPTTIVLDKQHRPAAVFLRAVSADELIELTDRLAEEA